MIVGVACLFCFIGAVISVDAQIVTYVTGG